MEATSLVPAAQYVRMSTEDQQYSIANQGAAIQTYAQKRGYVVVSTYADAGKSGVVIKHRRELQRLLHDVTSGQAQFKAILVYDVSRWGRFQDVDEAAHYEFLCKSAGIPVRYCAEQFDNDGSLPSTMMKALKRTMAAEFSRELGSKVSQGQRRIALLGFRVAGAAGYGLRRMMVSPDGGRRIVLEQGEHKAIQKDRVILVPGPKQEVDCVRTIFNLAANLRKTPSQIARELNNRHMQSWNGQSWDSWSVYRLLTKDKYTGCNTYGKTTQRLSSPIQNVERHLWTTKRDAFRPIVDRLTFDRAQELIQKRSTRPKKTDVDLIRAMKRVLAQKGKLSQRLLSGKGILDHRTYRLRFGSVMKAYELAGYQLPAATMKSSQSQRQIMLLRANLYARLKQLFAGRVRIISLPSQTLQQVVEIDGRLRVAVYLCRATNEISTGEPGWYLRVRALEKRLPALICTIDRSFTQLLNFYVFPSLGDSFPTTRIFRENQAWLSSGRKLEKLDDFCEVAKDVVSQSKNCEHYTAVDDILISSDTCTITFGGQEITLGPFGSAIFNMLVLNAGQVVSRYRLLRSVPGRVLEASHLNARIHRLRARIGIQARKRIQSVRGVGYVYVKPDKSMGCGSDGRSDGLR
jgi:DNA invertase Pin-like site-specific DNA recombinase/DNA-binding winged helix-turn-helix (wHTH) protein